MDGALRFDTPLDTGGTVDLIFGAAVDASLVALRFDTLSDASHPVDLTFGAVSHAPATAHLTLAATLPAPVLVALLAKVRALSLAATLPAPVLTAVLAYDNAVYRGPNGITASAWQEADARPAYTQDRMQDGIAMPARTVQPWRDADRLAASARNVLQNGIAAHRDSPTGWASAVRAGADMTNGYADMLRLRNRAATLWQAGARTGAHGRTASIAPGQRWPDDGRRHNSAASIAARRPVSRCACHSSAAPDGRSRCSRCPDITEPRRPSCRMCRAIRRPMACMWRCTLLLV